MEKLSAIIEEKKEHLERMHDSGVVLERRQHACREISDLEEVAREFTAMRDKFLQVTGVMTELNTALKAKKELKQEKADIAAKYNRAIMDVSDKLFALDSVLEGLPVVVVKKADEEEKMRKKKEIYAALFPGYDFEKKGDDVETMVNDPVIIDGVRAMIAGKKD
jgi:predicted DNA-binding protein (MmcQ/YjbR family)